MREEGETTHCFCIVGTMIRWLPLLLLTLSTSTSSDSHKNYFTLGGISRGERNFPLFKDQLEKSGIKIEKRKYHSMQNNPPG